MAIPPEPGDCCNDGCQRCVYDRCDEALERYRAEFRVWQLHHGDGSPPPR